MHFLTHDPIQNSITKLFASDPHPSVYTVMRDSDLKGSIRAEISELINYIVQDDVMSTLTQWALTTDKPKDEDGDRLVRSSVTIFSTECKSLQEKLQDNQIFIDALSKCMKNDMYNNLQICGHFQRITEAMIKYTNGGFLQHFPNLCSYLIGKINILALKELLLRLMTNFQEAFSEEEYQEIVIELAQTTQKENGYFAVTLMRDVITEKKATLSFFQNDKVLRELLTAAISNQKKNFNSLFEAIIFQLIEQISKDFPCSTYVIAEFSQKYQFNENKIDCGTVAALRIFKEGLYVLIPRFFKEPCITMLNALILDKLKEIPDTQLAGIVIKFNMVENIIKTFDDNRVNGHLTELALFLNKRSAICKTLQTDEWKKFVNEKLIPRDKERTVENLDDGDNSASFCIPSSNPKKQNLASFGSFSGGGGINALMQFAQAQMNKKAALSKAKIRPSSSENHNYSEFKLNFDNDSNDQNSNSNDNMSASSLLAPISSSSSSSTSSKPSKKANLKQAYSFSFPTVYQAEDSFSPMVC